MKTADSAVNRYSTWIMNSLNTLHFLSHEKAACFRADTELAKLTLAKPTLARMNRKKPAVLPQRVSSVTLGGVANLSTD
jgi:hypothetical protein